MNLPKEAMEEIKQFSEEVEKKYQQKESEIVELSDLCDNEFFDGLKIRPVSAGVIALLQCVDSPVFAGGAEVDFVDALVVCYLLCADKETEVFVAEARQGYEELKAKAIAWSFHFPAEKMLKLVEKMTKEIAGAFSGGIFSAEDEGDKKK